MRVLVNGAQGKMGTAVCDAIERDHELQLVGRCDKTHSLADEIRRREAQVVVDFTHPSCVYANTQIILDSDAYPVIGTTGLTLEQIHHLQDEADALKKGGVIAPNFSIGAALLLRAAQLAAPYFPDVEIIEAHHPQKADAPSGTARKTAEIIAQARTQSPTVPSSPESPKARGERYQDIHIHALRLPGCVADEQVLFSSLHESFSLTHRTIDRQCFMSGVLLACKKVSSLTELVYGLDKLLWPT